MTELFDEIFEEVMEELDFSEWWELFDDEAFDVVEERIAKHLGISLDELDEREDYIDWYNEMAMDL